MRERDPAARKLLGELLRFEALPWPAIRPAYSAALITLADRCVSKGAKAEVYRWIQRHLGGLLTARDDRWRECLVDAFHEAVALAPSLFLRFRAGLDPERRPNLRSMLAAWIIWRARNFCESRVHRHRRHAATTSLRAPTPAAPASPQVRAIARQVAERLASGDHAARGLLLHGLGDSIAEAARRTGASRQQIYRRREWLRGTD